MKSLMLLFALCGLLQAQVAPIQCLYFVHSPDNVAFSLMSPKPTFAPWVWVAIQTTAPDQIIQVTISYSDGTVVTPHTSLYKTPGWQSFSVTMPASVTITSLKASVLTVQSTVDAIVSK